jgi:hypothetical protein
MPSMRTKSPTEQTRPLLMNTPLAKSRIAGQAAAAMPAAINASASGKKLGASSQQRASRQEQVHDDQHGALVKFDCWV